MPGLQRDKPLSPQAQASTVSADANMASPKYEATEPMGKDFEIPSVDKCTQYDLTREMGLEQVALSS